MTTKNLLKTLIWPAVAGNVAWSFFTVLIQEGIHFPACFGRLSALLLLSIYLIIIFIRSQEGKGELIDILHSVSIILCAISIQANLPAMDAYLILFFAIAALGHWLGRWIPDQVSSKKNWRKALVGSIHLLGILICLFLPKFINNTHHINLSASLFVVLVLWLLLRDYIYLKWK